MKAVIAAFCLMTMSTLIVSQIIVLNEEEQYKQSIGLSNQDYYPGLIGFSRVANSGQTFTIHGVYFIVNGIPNAYKFIYGYFDGRTQTCTNIINDINNPGRCYMNNLPISWEFCSGEEQTCWINGSAIIRFGEGSKYLIFVGENNIPCNYRNLGDPSPYVTKHCGFLRIVWTHCGMEYSRCNFGGRKLVKYGAKGRNSYREADNGIDCNNGVFGDPIQRETKYCEYLPYDYKWVECARGNTKCRFFGISVVKVASEDGREVYYKDAAFEVNCQDRKICYYAIFN